MKNFIERGLALDRLQIKRQAVLYGPLGMSLKERNQRTRASLEFMNAFVNTAIFRVGGLVFVTEVALFKGLETFVH